MRSKVLFSLGVLVLVLGALGFAVGSGNGTVRTFAVILVVLSVYLIRTSKGQTAAVLVETTGPNSYSKLTNRPGSLLKVVSAVMLLLVSVSYFLLRRDAAHGSEQVWPVYLFAGTMVVASLVWATLVARLMSRLGLGRG
jgi:hypothetical protein